MMNIGENIKRVREAKGLSQKQVITAARMDAAQYSRLESGKTDPSISTLLKIAKALGVSAPDLFASPEELKEVRSHDKTVMEKVGMIEGLSNDERKVIYTMLDAFVSRKKLKDSLQNMLQNVK